MKNVKTIITSHSLACMQKGIHKANPIILIVEPQEELIFNTIKYPRIFKALPKYLIRVIHDIFL